jgi:hypothetical protein
MGLYVYSFMLVLFLILFLALLWHFCWPIFSLPTHKQAGDVLWSTICSSPAPRLIAHSVASAPPV